MALQVPTSTRAGRRSTSSGIEGAAGMSAPVTDADAVEIARQANEAAIVFARWARGLAIDRGDARLAMLIALIGDCDRDDDVMVSRAGFAASAGVMLDNMGHAVVAMAFADHLQAGTGGGR